MMKSPLVPGTIKAIWQEERDNVLTHEPVLQLVNAPVSALPTGASQSKYRLCLSDGYLFMPAAISTHHVEKALQRRQLERGMIFRLKSYTVNQGGAQKTKLLFITDFEYITTETIYGTPEPVDRVMQATRTNPLGSNQSHNLQSIQTDHVGSRLTDESRVNNALKVSRVNAAPAPTKPPVSEHVNVCPIQNITPYQNKWTIKARVVQKSEIKHWTNARGDGKLFNVTFMDESGEIRATAFNDQVDQFYDMLEENKAYYVSKARVNIAKKQFSSVRHEYELSFESGTEIRQACSAIPAIQYNFVEIGQLMNYEKDSSVDIIGVVKEDPGLSSIISKSTQKLVSKRELTIVDKSMYQVRLTLWGKHAETFDGSNEPIIACKGVRVNEFGGRSLSTMYSAIIQINPEIPEAETLRDWYNSKAGSIEFNSFTSGMVGIPNGSAGLNADERKTLAEVKELNLGMGDKASNSPDFFTVKGTIIFIRSENFCYPACPVDSKKVTEESDKTWRCEKCSKSYDSPDYRYILSIGIADHTGQAWLQAFNDVGIQIMGKTATELHTRKVENETLFSAAMTEANFKTYIFRCRAKMENFQDTTKVRYTIYTASPIDCVAECQRLIGIIDKYNTSISRH